MRVDTLYHDTSANPRRLGKLLQTTTNNHLLKVIVYLLCFTPSQTGDTLT